MRKSKDCPTDEIDRTLESVQLLPSGWPVDFIYTVFQDQNISLDVADIERIQQFSAD